ncbi:hypothetical protein [Nocardia blacklockiae]|uniref:hypothetical protein n=1 Tax=Nocardia blacklockiae TaxID=480036 RepID=UPI00189396E5|nr:hypothetical protein [Nocardia blacklockiae]MBF6174863.1 hypothetical protein [Nocardia blacklockiae]
MTAEGKLIDDIVGAIESVDGVRPATPLASQNATWLPLAGNRYAVDLAPSVVEIRVVAAALPLAPLVDKVAAAVRPLLKSTPWARATLRVVVADLAAEAFDDAAVT